MSDIDTIEIEEKPMKPQVETEEQRLNRKMIDWMRLQRKNNEENKEPIKKP